MNELENVNNINIDDLYNRIVALIENAKRNVATKVNDEMTLLYGDAVYETSSSGNSTAGSWDSSDSYFPNTSYPVFVRGGHAYNGSSAVVFAFHYNTGESYTNHSFRPVVLSSQP